MYIQTIVFYDTVSLCQLIHSITYFDYSSAKVASSSALKLPAAPLLLQMTSKASLRDWRKTKNNQNCKGNNWMSSKMFKVFSRTDLVEESVVLETLIYVCHVLAA